MNLFLPLFFGGVFFCETLKRRPAASKQWIDHPGGETPKAIPNSQTYLARITRFLTPCPRDASQPGTQESLGTVIPTTCFPPVILVNASIRIPGDDSLQALCFRYASSFANCVLAFAKRKCFFFLCVCWGNQHKHGKQLMGKGWWPFFQGK